MALIKHLNASDEPVKLTWDDAQQWQQGVLEATHTSTWWGFKDDIAIRVRGQSDGTTQIDVRSISRVGQSDLGANAKRITYFLYDLEGQRYD